MYAAMANDTLAVAIAAHPDRFGGWITLYPEDPEWSVKEILGKNAMALGFGK